MLMVVTNAGKIVFLARALRGEGAQSTNTMELALYANDYTPDDETELADLTEATFPGYARIPLDPDTFPVPELDENVAQTDYPAPVEWICTGGSGEEVFGWFVVCPDNDEVWLAQRFDTSRNMVPTATINLDPFRVKCKSFD